MAPVCRRVGPCHSDALRRPRHARRTAAARVAGARAAAPWVAAVACLAVLAAGRARAQAGGELPALGRPGGTQSEGCTVVPLLHADEPRRWDHILGSFTLLHGGRPSMGLPAAADLRQAVADTWCELSTGAQVHCLRGAYVQFDVQVPHLTTKLTRVRLLDGAGRVAIDLAV